MTSSISKPSRSRRLIPLVVALVVAPVAAYALTACGPSVSEETVEEAVSDGIADKVGLRPKEVDCPGGMPLKVGGEAHCTLTVIADRKIGLDVKIASIDGAKPEFEYDVDLAKLLEKSRCLPTVMEGIVALSRRCRVEAGVLALKNIKN